MNAISLYKTPEGEKIVMELYDRVLGNWPVPCRTVRLPTRHGETFVIESGDVSNPPLVLLHGASSNAVSWVGDVVEYSPRFRVFAVDIPGDPGKSAQVRPSWEGPGYAEWLEDVLNGLGLERASLLGLSQGGWTALKFAVLRPERVEKLVLLTPAGIVPTKASFLLKAVVLSMFGRRGADRLNRIVAGDVPMHPEAMKFMSAVMTHFSARFEKEYVFTDEELARLSMPVLLVGGMKDALRSIRDMDARLKKFAPRLTTDMIPDTGHVLVGITGRIIPFLTE